MIKEYVRFTDIVDIYTNIIKHHYKGEIKDWSICFKFIVKRCFEIFKGICNAVNNKNSNVLVAAWHNAHKEMLFREVMHNIDKYYELTSISDRYDKDEFEKLFNYSFYKGVLIEFQDFIISEYYSAIEVFAYSDVDNGAFDDYLKKQLETDNYLPI